ncbi:tyrosine-type recombinase/integrase [Actinotalea sp. JY-7876]|uniref:tyrosine-type recombinase/integrase n=1 Tax=Actinotalea sp. JY-7876 TaxID=2758442 RepID=UPI0015F3E8A2|nr:tyrosine-type recombinase/integrase [Actinotalea sp. JY-7876]
MATYLEDSKRWVATARYRDPITGKQRRKYLYGATALAADDAAKKFRSTPASARPSEDRPDTVRVLLGRWLSEKDPSLDRRAVAWTFTEATVQRDQWKDYESTVRVHILPSLGDVRLDDITHGRLLGFFTELAGRDSRRGGRLSASSQKKVHSRLTSAFRYCVLRGWLSADPMSGVPTPTDSPEDAELRVTLTPVEKALTVAEMRALTRWIAVRYDDHLAYQVRWALAFEIGLRQAEMLGLTWDCVDLTTRTITVRQQLRHIEHQHGCEGKWPDPTTSPCTVVARESNPRQKPLTAYRCPHRVTGGAIIVATTKSKRVRYVRFSRTIADSLKALCAEQHPSDAPTASKAERLRLLQARSMRVYAALDADLVIRTPGGGHVTPTVDNGVWHAACDGAGVSSIGRDVHSARHTAATHLVAAGVALTTVQKMLGHSTTAVTERYVTTAVDVQDAALYAREAYLARV